MGRRRYPQFRLVLVITLLLALVGPVRPGMVQAAGSGAILSWGGDSEGQLGDGGELPGPDRTSPVEVAGPGGSGTLEGAKAIAAGGRYSLALKSDGTVWAWGRDEFGQLGNGGNIPGTDQSAPVQAVGPGGVGTLGGVQAIAAGQHHSLALKFDGTVWAWGRDDSSQLGDGGIIPGSDQAAPVQVVGPGGVGTLTGIQAIAAGAFHSLALKFDGTVWAWGSGNFGQLGDGGNTTTQVSPVQVVGPGGVGTLGGVAAIAAGGGHSLALKSDGTVWAWGNATRGELGDGQCSANRNSPVQVMGPGGSGTLGGMAAIAAGGGQSLALKSDGTVWAWGTDVNGELGNGTGSPTSCSGNPGATSPVQVVGSGGSGTLGGVAAIVAGDGHSLALRKREQTISFMAQANRPLELRFAVRASASSGLPVTFTSATPAVCTVDGDGYPVKLLALGTCTLVANQAGDRTYEAAPPVSRSFQVTVGDVWAWGFDAWGALGDGTEGEPFHVATPGQVLGPASGTFLGNAIAVTGGRDYSVALLADGTVWAWGNNVSGQLGNGTANIDVNATPSQVVAPGGGFLTDVVDISAGYYHVLALKRDGTVWVWGNGSYGQLGNGAVGTLQYTPGPVAALTDVVDIAAGEYHSLVLKSDGTVWAWGRDTDGQLGDGTLWGPEYDAIPNQVVGSAGAFDDVIAIAAGYYHSMALKADGTVWTWGDNNSGQLGNGGVGGFPSKIVTPQKVIAPGGSGAYLASVVAIAAGGQHSLALSENGTAWAWGYDAHGQLGDGTVESPNGSGTPSQVVAPGGGYLTGLSDIAAGYFHSMALESDGAVWAWGNDSYGNLGDGTELNPQNSAVPSRVVAPGGGYLTDVIAIAPLFSHSLALKSLPAPLPASLLAVNPVTATAGNNVTLTATLTGNSVGLSGQTVSFSLQGTPVGTAVTNASGVATLSASLGSIPAGDYPTGVSAAFAGSQVYAASSATAALTVTSPPEVVLTTGSIGSGGGTVSPPSGPVPVGTVVSVSAAAAAGSLFTGWLVDGVPAGWSNPLSITMDDNHTVQATFTLASSFPDVGSGRADYAAIVALASRGTIRGYADGRYGPDDGVQRAQMAALIARAMPSGPGTPPTTLAPPACLAGGTWDCEDWGNNFQDRNGLDANLWRNIGTLQHYQVAKGYDGAACADRNIPSPCFAPTAPVSYVETITFITRAMIAKGYWVLQAGAAQPYTGVPGVFAPEVATFHFYTQAAGGVPAPPGDWNAGATRGWFAQALWQALNTYWGTGGTLPDGRPAGGATP